MNKSNKLIRFDWAIKHLLRQKQNFDILEGFLSALLKEDIIILQLLDTEANQDDEYDKFNRVDILVEDSQKRQIIIEVQNTRETGYLKRMLYGVSKNIVENIKVGDKYNKVVKVISISILYFNLGLGEDYLYKGATHFTGMNTNEPLKVREKVLQIDEAGKKNITYKEKDIFPEYYLIQVERYQNEVENAIDEWVYMLKHNEVKEEFKAKHINKAKKKLQEMNMTQGERKSYERFLENLAIERDKVDTAKDEGLAEGRKEGREEGLAEGREEGLAEGREEGLAEGREEGLAEGREKGKTEMLVATTINGFKAGLAVEVLSQITGMTIEEVTQILTKHGLT